MEKLTIEKDKIGVLIGKKGVSKRRIERELSVRLNISKNGDVKIIGKSVQTFVAFNVVDAVSMGFSVRDALELKDPDFVLERINLRSFARSKARMQEIKGRLIGTSGRSKKTIQNLSNVLISVSEHSIGLIGNLEDIAMSKEAIKSLLQGAKHGRIFKWLEHRSRFFKKVSSETFK